jgi:hypothetical protein
MKYCHVFIVLTNNNGFSIGWLDLVTPSFTISLDHNQWLPRNHSIPCWTTTVLNDNLLTNEWLLKSESKSRCDWRSVSHKVLVSSPIWGSWPDIYCLTVTVLFCGVPSLTRGRVCILYVYAAGPCQCSLSQVRVSWHSQPYFTVPDLRFPFSSAPTTRRVTVEAFDPTFTRVWITS